MVAWVPSINARPGTRARAIADAIGEDIAAGRLQAGDRLPPQRDLADVLGLSPNTVMRAYAEATRRGYVEGEVGRGTFVRAVGGTVRGSAETTLVRPGVGPIDLSVGLPFIGEAGEALSATLSAITRDGDPARFLDHGDADVRRSQVDAAVTWLGRLGLAAEADRLVVTNGAQHGVFTTLLALLRSGDLLLTENLTYAPIKVIARRLGVTIRALAMDGEGILPESLEAASRTGRAAVLYCTPTLQTPTTATMGEERRRRIAAIAATHDLTVVEDDVFGFLPGTRPLPLSVFAPERTVFVTSVSKSTGPGLRVGYVHAPRRLVPAIASAVSASCWMLPPLMAEIARRWIEDGTAARLTEAQRSHAARRQAMARTALAGRPYRADPQGLHLWLPLPGHWSSRAFATAAEHAGVLVNPAETFATGAVAPSAVRLCLSHEIADERVARGLAIISALLDGPGDEGALVV